MTQTAITATNGKNQGAKRPWPFLVSKDSSPRQSSAYALAMANLDQLIAARSLLAAAPMAGGASEAAPGHGGAALSAIPCGNYGDNLTDSHIRGQK